MNFTARKAALYATAANCVWGFFPVYFHLFTGISALEVLAHRALWSLAFVLLAVAAMGKLADALTLIQDIKRLRWFLASGTLIAINWGGFIWAATHGQILQSGLGYYIYPLVSVALGSVFLKERLSPRQQVSILLAGAGVGVLILAQGQVPWISLVLACSFALYGLVRKQAPADSLLGLFAETLLLAPLAALYMIWLEIQGQAAFLHQGAGLDALLLLGGLLTAIPLVLFAKAARKLTLTSLGLLFYLNPTLQFLLAIFVYDEGFTPSHAIAFCFIWSALALYSWGAWKTAG